MKLVDLSPTPNSPKTSEKSPRANDCKGTFRKKCEFDPKGPTKKISEHSITKDVHIYTEANFQSVSSTMGCSSFVKKEKGLFRCILVQFFFNIISTILSNDIDRVSIRSTF